MDKTAKRSSTTLGVSNSAVATTASIKDLPESIIIWDILVRLPTKDVLRHRAVCKSWRRGTSTHDFAVAHHQRQPLLPLIQQFEEEFEVYWDFKECCDDPCFMVLHNHNLFPIVRCSTPGGAKLKVHGACDGFLLISYTDTSCLQVRHLPQFYVCSPATRQSTGLNWQLTHFIQVVGFYGHSSGEYRVLYWLLMEHSKKKSVDGKLLEFSRDAGAELVEYYILTLGSNEPRCLGGPPPETLPSLYGVWIGLKGYFKGPPVLYRGCLHWGSDSTCFSVFNTVAETFRSMRSPSHQLVTDLFVLVTNGDLDLCAASVGVTVMKLWVLQDYEAELWNLKFQISLLSVVAPPWRDKVLESSSTRTLRAALLGENELLVQVSGRMFLCDTAGRFLRNVKPDEGIHTLQIAWHWYRESMIPPPAMQPPAFPVTQSAFLLGV